MGTVKREAVNAVVGFAIGLTLRERMDAPAQENRRDEQHEAMAGHSGKSWRSSGADSP